MIRIEDGWHIPANDPTPIKQRLGTVWHLAKAMEFCPEPCHCIQAGGNLGQWPVWLSKAFKQVITFEPSPINFECLTKNIIDYPNIKAHNYALGNTTSELLFTEEANCEASHMTYNSPGASDISVKSIRLDDFNTPYGVDFLCLDIEGHELYALQGAVETLRAHRPLVMLERGHEVRAGYLWSHVEAFMQELGYTKVDQANKDEIWKFR